MAISPKEAGGNNVDLWVKRLEEEIDSSIRSHYRDGRKAVDVSLSSRFFDPTKGGTETMDRIVHLYEEAGWFIQLVEDGDRLMYTAHLSPR